MKIQKKLYFYSHPKDNETHLMNSLIVIAVKNHFEVVYDHEKADVIVSMGGDGAFLQAVRQTGFRQDCLYVGVTHVKDTALYCDFNIDNFDNMLQAMLNEDLKVRQFPVINVEINDEITFYCLNEVSVRSTIIKTIVIDVFIDDLLFETFRGDGLIIATPTGSTAYNKSTSGAVIDPLIPCFQVTELASLNNNTYRTLGSSFVLNKNRHLRLEIVQDGNTYPIIGLDNEAYPIRNIQSVSVSLSNRVVKTVRLKDNSYWDRVKRTFL